jgi:predicted  nucleic acid-binding Zn-ribbon protein
VEKTSLEAAKADAEMKVKELDKQKHDRETLAELAVAKKEVEALKVTVTQMEEERESKGSQQLGELEGRVTELDQKLWEATQSEVKGDIEIFCASLVHPLS